ncbi:chromate transporter [Roseateles sp.]|uniref:chromate transporter n=1 Tax=Roseateles sp. TaxID=1971397 RepID=UPI0037C6C770
MSQGARAPRSLTELFWAFSRLALQGFGGVIAVAQRELVERLQWMSREEFVEALAAAQVLPGPNVINLSLMIGDRFFGLRGAFVALAGMLCFPSVIVLGLAALAGHYLAMPQVAGALRGMGAVSAGLILATALKLLPALKSSPLGLLPALLIAALAIVAIAIVRMPLIWVVLGLGGLGMLLAARRLGQEKAM